MEFQWRIQAQLKNGCSYPCKNSSSNHYSGQIALAFYILVLEMILNSMKKKKPQHFKIHFMTHFCGLFRLKVAHSFPILDWVSIIPPDLGLPQPKHREVFYICLTFSRGSLHQGAVFPGFSLSEISYSFQKKANKFFTDSVGPLLVQNIRLVRSVYFLSWYLFGYFSSG